MLDLFFSANAARSGGAVAIVDRRRAYTYSEIDRLSDVMSSRLLNMGIGRGSRVGIALEPDASSVAAIIAVLKTGACFVYLDIGLEAGALRDMVRRSGAELVLLSEKKQEMISTGGAAVVLMKELAARDPSPPIRFHHADRRLADPAFISFTTGTTGTKKGVAVSHGSAVYAYRNFWHEAARAGECSRFAVFSYFDWDTLGSLVHGRTCFLPPTEVLAEPKLIAAYIHEREINHCFLTPSQINAMLAEVPPSILRNLLRSLNVVWAGGEVLKTETVRRLIALNPDVAVINNYGPSECFVVSQGRVDNEGSSRSEICSVGTVLPGTKGVIVGPDFTPLGCGEVGTLCVAGPCLVDGYLDDVRDEKNPFIILKGDRYFWTGDMARFGFKGDLYILGRQPRDSLPELSSGAHRSVEAKLMQFADVAACVHCHHVDESGDIVNLVFVVMADYMLGNSRKSLRLQSAASIHALCNVPAGERLAGYEVRRIPLSGGSRKADIRKLLAGRSEAQRLW